ncbi:MAG: MFS transporter [Candidatus Aminicenantes bacterium]|nr:MFS transporter [Candidatus Aminicenantes bacterium]
MNERNLKAYGYRWVVLLAFVLLGAMTQVLWISFAPITSEAAKFYGRSDLMIGLLSMVFMAVYILIVIPSAWAIDTLGFKTAVGIGAVATGGFGLARGLFASNFTMVFICQIGLAFGQPFVLGAITTLAARWFPAKERATAAGLGTLALYLGPLAAMFLTPMLLVRVGMVRMLTIYGIAAAVSAVLFLLLARDRPPTPVGREERALMFDGLRSMMKRRDFLFLLGIFFIGLGLFNCVSTWIEDIVRPRGFSIAQAGRVGGLMLIGGILGAVIMPLLSDKFRRRKPFIILAVAGLLPGLLGLTFAADIRLLMLSGFFVGFFLLSAGPIGFQYAAEITHPAPEGTSNSLLLVSGQISGIIFILAMDALKNKATGSMTTSLLGLAGLVAGAILLALFLPESPVCREAQKIDPLG